MVFSRALKSLLLPAIITIFMPITSCTGKNEGVLIISEVRGAVKNPDFRNGPDWRYISGSRIVTVNPDKDKSAKVLTSDFHSACFPDISQDGKKILFAGQQKEGDQWQIWEMDLRSRKTRIIPAMTGDCSDPVYLPGGRILFSSRTINDHPVSGHPLFTVNPDGSDVRQITFNPNANFASTILRDGRILTISRDLLTAHKEPFLLVLRPDGTKSDKFYGSQPGGVIIGRPRETSGGRIWFIESEDENALSGDLVSVEYNRPLNSRNKRGSGTAGSFNSVLPLRAGGLLVSCRLPGSADFAVYMFDTETMRVGNVVYNNPGYNVVDIIETGEYERPKKLPSEVDVQVKTGLLLCQDINFTGIGSLISETTSSKASRIEIMGIDSTYGIVPVEEDGSFYLKVVADKPFRIRTIDINGNVINGPCSWIWLRPNERRGCIGCHEDPELVPGNRLPSAVKKQPVIIPVHKGVIREKIVELE